METLETLIGEDRLSTWLNKPNPAFENQKPIDMIDNGQSDRIWEMIHQVDANVAS